MIKKIIKNICLTLVIMMMLIISTGVTSNVMAATDPSHGTLEIKYINIENSEIVDTRSINGPVGSEWDEIPQIDPWTFADKPREYTGETQGYYEEETKELTVYVEMGHAYISFIDLIRNNLIGSVVLKGKVGTDWDYDIPVIPGYKYLETVDYTDSKLVANDVNANVYYIYQKVLDSVTIEVEETKIIEIANPCYMSYRNHNSEVNDNCHYIPGEWRVKDTSLLTIKHQQLSTDLKNYTITLIGEAIGETDLELWVSSIKERVNDEFVCAEIPVTIIAKEIPEPEVKESTVKVTYEDLNGNKIADTVNKKGKVDSDWTTDKLVIKDYEFVKVIGDTAGKFIDSEILVKYIYKKVIPPVVNNSLKEKIPRVI